MQHQLFVVVVVAIIGCVVVAGQESDEETFLAAKIAEISQRDAKSMAMLLRTMNRDKLTPQSGESQIVDGLTKFLLSGDLGAKYRSERSKGRKPSTAFDVVFVSELVVPCENVVELIGDPVEEIEIAGLEVTQEQTHTWIAIAKYCQKIIDNEDNMGELCYEKAQEKKLL